MGLFKPDLYRSFAIGFALGAAAFAGAMTMRADAARGGMIATAQAAPVAIDQTR
jgi:hypothetical protein